jgi:predicted RNA-binding protein (virulence factor B family)
MEQEFRYLKEIVGKGVFKDGQEVDVVIYAFTKLGAKVAINDTYSGLAYGNEIFENVELGQKCKAYIKRVRDDGKIDVSLRPSEGKHVLGITETIYKALAASGGRLPFNDNSSPEDIKKRFQISKKVFKKAIGVLYKQRRILITSAGIEIPSPVRGK